MCIRDRYQTELDKLADRLFDQGDDSHACSLYLAMYRLHGTFGLAHIDFRTGKSAHSPRRIREEYEARYRVTALFSGKRGMMVKVGASHFHVWSCICLLYTSGPGGGGTAGLVPGVGQPADCLLGGSRPPAGPGDLSLIHIYALNQMGNLSEEQKEASLESLRQMVESAKAAADLEDAQMLLNVPMSYWASLNAMDTAEAARELTIPMLFLQGTADFQVKMETDFAAWQQALEGHSNAQFQSYEGLNHLFMPTNGKMDASEYETPGQVDSRVIGDIAAFIQGNAET